MIGADGLHFGVREIAFGPERQFERYLGYKVAAFEVPGYRPRDEFGVPDCTRKWGSRSGGFPSVETARCSCSFMKTHHLRYLITLLRKKTLCGSGLEKAAGNVRRFSGTRFSQ